MRQLKWKHPGQLVALSCFIWNATSFSSRIVTGIVTFDFFRVCWDPSQLSVLQTRLLSLIQREPPERSRSFNPLKPQRSAWAALAKPFPWFTLRGQTHASLLQVCGLRWVPLVWVTGMDWKYFIQMPSSSRPIGLEIYLSHRTPQSRQLTILCSNASMICKASNISLPQS